MKIRYFLARAVWTAAPSGAACAETVVVDDQVMVRESTVARPARGLTMAAVEANSALRWRAIPGGRSADHALGLRRVRRVLRGRPRDPRGRHERLPECPEAARCTRACDQLPGPVSCRVLAARPAAGNAILVLAQTPVPTP